MNLEELRSECLNCQKCKLCTTRTNVVFGVGSPNADVLFIGEGPGENEDLQGEPFVGRAGKLLDDMLAMIGLDRSRIYITNSVKCRPPLLSFRRLQHPGKLPCRHRFLLKISQKSFQHRQIFRLFCHPQLSGQQLQPLPAGSRRQRR